MELSEQERAFIDRYINHWGLGRAVREAGLSTGDDESDKQLALDMIDRPNVRDEMHRVLERRSSRLEMAADDVIRRIAGISSVDVAQAYDANGCLLPIHEIPRPVRQSIAGVKTRELFNSKGELQGYTQEVKWIDPLKALELLGRHMRLFTDKFEFGGAAGELADELNKARRRASNESFEEKYL